MRFLMKRKLQDKARRIAQNPVIRQSVRQMKPHKSVWGLFGIVVFFFVPEIIAFAWGADITAWATHRLAFAGSDADSLFYRTLVYLFEDGGSWLNIGIGIAFLVWWFY